MRGRGTKVHPQQEGEERAASSLATGETSRGKNKEEDEDEEGREEGGEERRSLTGRWVALHSSTALANCSCFKGRKREKISTVSVPPSLPPSLPPYPPHCLLITLPKRLRQIHRRRQPSLPPSLPPSLLLCVEGAERGEKAMGGL